MEKAVVDWEQNTLLIVLTQGKELAELLRNRQLDPSLSQEDCHLLIEKILSSYEKALSMLKWGPSAAQIKPISLTSESYPISLSPKSDKFRGDVSKKRKTEPRWTEQVKACLGTGMEGPLYDGHSWRKYGQKDIFGAKFPRAYYRCTHRHSQGCLATKQVQRSDEDPTIFEVTYRGRHTCIQPTLPNTRPKQIMGSFQIDPLVEEKPNPFTNIGEAIKTEVSDSGDKIFPASSFPYASIGNENGENSIFIDSILGNSCFLASHSPTFISPTTSEKNLMSMSPCHMDNIGPENNSYFMELDLTEIVSVHTSVKNLPMGEFEINFEDGGFNYSHIGAADPGQDVEGF